MSSNAMSLKAKINNYASKNHIAAQVVLQNYMFERFLVRLSKSKYKEKFIIKGGMLVAAIVGLDTRSTKDLDATLKGFPLDDVSINEAIKQINQIELNDEVSFNLVSVTPIRQDDQYGGFCVRIDALYDTIITPLSIDISTGDVITPAAVMYEFNGIFDEGLSIKLWGYNIETLMAEKMETILRRGIFNTRPRDYYDIYILSTKQSFDKQIFEEALEATSKHRGSFDNISDRVSIISKISASEDLQKMWKKYQQRFLYANQISFSDIIGELKSVLDI